MKYTTDPLPIESVNRFRRENVARRPGFLISQNLGESIMRPIRRFLLCITLTLILNTSAWAGIIEFPAPSPENSATYQSAQSDGIQLHDQIQDEDGNSVTDAVLELLPPFLLFF